MLAIEYLHFTLLGSKLHLERESLIWSCVVFDVVPNFKVFHDVKMSEIRKSLIREKIHRENH